MKTGSKLLLTLLCLAATAVAAVLVLHFVFKVNIWPFAEKNEDQRSEDSVFLSDTYPADIAVYGADIIFPRDIPQRKIASLGDSELDAAGRRFFYRVVVINDTNGDCDISGEELDYLRGKLDDGWDVFYIGTRFIDEILALSEREATRREGDLSACLVHDAVTGTVVPAYGLWTERDAAELQKNRAGLGQCIVGVVKSEIRQRAKTTDLQQGGPSALYTEFLPKPA